MWVRDAVPGDAGALAGIFYDAVQQAGDYTVTQRNAWAPRRPTVSDWAQRLDGLLTLVAVDQDPLGFVSARMSDGYLDLAFVDPSRQGVGVFDCLHTMLENRARAAGLRRLYTQASLALSPVLERRGWRVVRPNRVERAGQILRNFVMERPFDPIALN